MQIHARFQTLNPKQLNNKFFIQLNLMINYKDMGPFKWENIKSPIRNQTPYTTSKRKKSSKELKHKNEKKAKIKKKKPTLVGLDT